MAVEKLPEFAKTGQKNTDGLDLEAGFPVNLKPARQWFNFLFNKLVSSINALIDENYIRHDEIINDLESSSKDKPLSATQGKKLQDEKFKSNGTQSISSDFPSWDSKSGVYTKTNESLQQTVLHFLGYGSASAVQFLVDYSNGGISYRSARDNLGFEKTFEKLITEKSGKAMAAAEADTAGKLKTARQINGVDFDGSSNITLPMLGRGQSYSATAKVGNTNYINSSESPIYEKLVVQGGGSQINIWVDGVRVTGSTQIPLNQIVYIDFVVQPKKAYAVTTNSNKILEWSSLGS